MQRPTLAFAMDPDLTPDLISPEQHRMLAARCHIPRPTPLTDFTDPRVRDLLRRTEILLTGWGCPTLDAAAIDLTPRLRLVLHAGGSVKPFVTDAVWARGVVVVSAAAANAAPVAEFALAAILLAAKGAFANRERYRAARAAWRLPWTAPGTPGNFGATVGVVGASRIGRRLLHLLRDFDHERLLADPFVTPHEAMSLGATLLPLDELLARSTVVSLHAPLLAETHGLIDKRRLASMPTGATLINTARGALVDSAALKAELRAGRLHAVLDVTDPEPLPPDDPLFDLTGAFVTTHIAGAAGRETRRLTDLVIAELDRFLAGHDLRHRVTQDMLTHVA